MRCQAVTVAGRVVGVCERDARVFLTHKWECWPGGYLLCEGCLFRVARSGQFDNCLGAWVEWPQSG